MGACAQEVPIDLQLDAVRAICQHHGVARLRVLGSMLRDDFGPDSAIDDRLCSLRPVEWVEPHCLHPIRRDDFPAEERGM